MPLKIDANGIAVLQEGNPVWVHDDGRELPFDIGGAMKKISDLGAEAKNHRLKFEDASEKLKAFGDLTPDNAKKAIATLKNLDDKKLVDAGEVEALKRQMGEIYETEKANLLKTHATEKDVIVGENKKHADTIRHLLISSAFASSPYFTGPEPKTILPPDMASEYFGKNFKVEGEGPNVKIIGYIGDEKIPSRINVGEVAGFNEAIGAIIDRYPLKDRILSTSSGGSGSAGNLQQSGDTKFVTLSKADSKDVSKYRIAREKAEKAGVPLRII